MTANQVAHEIGTLYGFEDTKTIDAYRIAGYAEARPVWAYLRMLKYRRMVNKWHKYTKHSRG